MFNDMDDLALYGSEVFRNLVKQELEKEAAIKQSESEVLDNFLKFQEKVNSDSNLRKQFKKIQDRMINDSEYRRANNEAFVQGIMLLKLEDE